MSAALLSLRMADTPPEERGRISRPNCHRLLGIVLFIAILDSFPWSSIVLYGNFGLQRAGPETSFSSYMPLASISGSHTFFGTADLNKKLYVAGHVFMPYAYSTKIDLPPTASGIKSAT